MSDALLQSALIYQEISKYEYYFIFGDKKRNLYYIPIKLKNENYPHLLGIDKLTDKKEVILSRITSFLVFAHGDKETTSYFCSRFI